MPIQFADLGKKTKDLLSKKYDYKTEFKAVTKSPENHVKIEAGGSGRAVQGWMKVFYKNKDFGKLEVEVHSNAEVGDKAKLKLNKLVDNVSLTLSASSLATVGLEATFKKDKVAANLELLHCEKSTNAGLSGTVSMGDVTVGGCVDVEAPSGNVVLKDYNAGAEFRYKKFTAAVKTANLRNEITLSVFHKLAKHLHWGGAVVVRPNEGFAPNLTVGVSYGLSKAVSVKAKADSGGALAVALEHRLENPRFKFNVAAEYDCSKACGQPARQFGVSLVYGDY